jgi:F0F1-type ATP synthase delta subunit
MRVPRTQVARTLSAMTMKSGVNKKLSREIAAYILESGQFNELDSILRDIQDDWAKHGIINITAVSAFALSDDVKNDIRSHVRSVYPHASQFIINERRDPAIIGGVRIELPNQQLDLSIQAKLHQFKQATISGKDASA